MHGGTYTYLTHQASRRRSGGDRSVWIYGSAVALQPCIARLFCGLCDVGASHRATCIFFSFTLASNIYRLQRAL